MYRKCVGRVTKDPRFSHDGLHDLLTNCAAPPLFYSHINRMITGSSRTGASFSLLSISIPLLSTTEEIAATAHVINQLMRKEDLCGRLGHYQFVIALAGDHLGAEKLLERVLLALPKELSPLATGEIVQWSLGESSLKLLHRLDLLAHTS